MKLPNVKFLFYLFYRNYSWIKIPSHIETWYKYNAKSILVLDWFQDCCKTGIRSGLLFFMVINQGYYGYHII